MLHVTDHIRPTLFLLWAKARQKRGRWRPPSAKFNMGTETDGHMKRSTCFWHRTSTLVAWFRVE